GRGAVRRRGAPAAEKSGPGYNDWRGGSLKELSDEAVEQMAATAQQAPAGCSIGVGHYMHVQVCRVSQDATPLRRTAGQFTYFFKPNWNDAPTAEAPRRWGR